MHPDFPGGFNDGNPAYCNRACPWCISNTAAGACVAAAILRGVASHQARSSEATKDALLDPFGEQTEANHPNNDFDEIGRVPASEHEQGAVNGSWCRTPWTSMASGDALAHVDEAQRPVHLRVWRKQRHDRTPRHCRSRWRSCIGDLPVTKVRVASVSSFFHRRRRR